MTRDLQREFQLLSSSAKQHLRDVPAIRKFRHVFSLWKLPSFSPAHRCSVYSPTPAAKGKGPFAIFTIWRSDLDLEKFRTPVERLKYPKELSPTFKEHTLELTDADIEDFERRIQGISIPIYLGPSRTVGMDGTSFEFQCDEFFFGASIHWWEDEPTRWRPLTDKLRRILEELDERRKKKVK